MNGCVIDDNGMSSMSFSISILYVAILDGMFDYSFIIIEYVLLKHKHIYY